MENEGSGFSAPRRGFSFIHSSTYSTTRTSPLPGRRLGNNVSQIGARAASSRNSCMPSVNSWIIGSPCPCAASSVLSTRIRVSDAPSAITEEGLSSSAPKGTAGQWCRAAARLDPSGIVRGRGRAAGGAGKAGRSGRSGGLRGPDWQLVGQLAQSGASPLALGLVGLLEILLYTASTLVSIVNSKKQALLKGS